MLCGSNDPLPGGQLGLSVSDPPTHNTCHTRWLPGAAILHPLHQLRPLHVFPTHAHAHAHAHPPTSGSLHGMNRPASTSTPAMQLMPEPDRDDVPHIVGVSSVASELEGVPTSVESYDHISGRDKRNGETSFYVNNYNNLKDTHVTIYQERRTTCACACWVECEHGRQGPAAGKFVVPLSLAVNHFIVLEVEEQTGCGAASFQELRALAAPGSPHQASVQSAVRAVLDFLPYGEYQGRLENEALRDSQRPTDKWRYMPIISRSKRSLSGLFSDKPVEMLAALAVHSSKCVIRVFPRSFQFSPTKTSVKLDISLQIDSSRDLIELVREVVGNEYDTILKRILHFSMENSKTAVDYRNSVFAMYNDALPQSKYYPAHILKRKKEKAWSLIESIPCRLGELICDAAFYSPLLCAETGVKDDRGWVTHTLLSKQVRSHMLKHYQCSDSSLKRIIDALRTGSEFRASDGSRAFYSTEVGFQKLKALFEAKLNAGNMALLIAHKLIREEALKHLPEGAATRDADGYPLLIALRGVRLEFFDADLVASGITNLSVTTRVYGKGGCFSESTVVRQDLPYNRVPRMEGQDTAKESKTHRSKDFGGKVVAAAWILSDPVHVDAALGEHSPWLVRSLPGQTLKWDSMGLQAQVRYATWTLAFLDGYLFFQHPDSRVLFDPVSVTPNNPLCQEWGKKSGPHGTPISPADVVQVECRVAGTRHPCVVADSTPLLKMTDTARTKKAVLLPFLKEAARTPPQSRVRGASASAIFSITKRARWNSLEVDSLRAGIARDRVVKCYANLRRAKIPSGEFAEWCRLHPDVLDRLDEAQQQVETFYYSGVCPETLPAMVHADLLLCAINACSTVQDKKQAGRAARQLSQNTEEYIDCRTGEAILELMVGEFAPAREPHTAKLQRSCGGNGSTKPVTFGVACGLKDSTLVDFRDGWDATWLHEQRLFTELVSSRQAAINAIWTFEASRGGDIVSSVAKTAELCKQVVCARFGVHMPKPWCYEDDWGEWKPEQDVFLKHIIKKYPAKVVSEMNRKLLCSTAGLTTDKADHDSDSD